MTKTPQTLSSSKIDEPKAKPSALAPEPVDAHEALASLAASIGPTDIVYAHDEGLAAPADPQDAYLAALDRRVMQLEDQMHDLISNIASIRAHFGDKIS